MFSIDNIIHEIGQVQTMDERISLLSQYNGKTLEKIRKPVHASREDEKCYLCHHKITKQDSVLPNVVLESELGHVVHGQCLEYSIRKYPNVSISELEGKIVRIKVEQSNV